MTTLFDSDDTVEIKDFTIKQKLIRFRVDNDVFTAHRILSLPLMQSLLKISSNISAVMKEENYEVIFDLFDAILEPESALRFRQRAMSIGVDALDVKAQLLPIMHYIIESAGLRPTQPSLTSSDGLRDGNSGTSLTDGSAQTV